MLSSKQLIEITGISRATLNNYVALGILPNPLVKTHSGDAGRTTRLGYFEDSAVELIEQVQLLKRQGHTMADIAQQIGTQPPSHGGDAVVAEHQQAPLSHLSLEGSGKLPGPAYMVNNNFELIWWNDSATRSLFQLPCDMPDELASRNLLKILFDSPLCQDTACLRDLLLPHLAAGRKRLSQSALMKVYSCLEAEQLALLNSVEADVRPIADEVVLHFPILLPQGDEPASTWDLYVCFYREGILFTYSPVRLQDDYLLEFLSKRNYVINELLRHRRPCLTAVTVMVADVQNSTRICSELPAEEYFELINSIWQESEPIFRQFYGTYGKHAGDGMVYYFFPQPDCDYKLNAIQCALELRAMMQRITQAWQARKGWFSDIHLNIGLNEGQEWFGSYHAGGHVEFTVLGQSINYASRISDFAHDGSIWATKTMLNQIEAPKRARINFGISRKTQNDEAVFVTDSYAPLGSLLSEEQRNVSKFTDLEMLPITEIRDIRP